MSNHTVSELNDVILVEEFPRLNTPDVRIVRAEDLNIGSRILVNDWDTSTHIVQVKSIFINDSYVSMKVDYPSTGIREISCAHGVQFVWID